MSPRTGMLIPSVVEANARGDRSYDIYSLLLKERVVFLGTAIDSQVANLIVAQLLWLDREDPDSEIRMYINCPGGEVYAGFAIHDTMQLVKAPVSTFAIGLTASFGTILLTSGAKGRRFAMPNATIHMHQPLGGAQGQTSDIVIAAQEIVRSRERLNHILMDSTGQPKEVIERDTDRDYYLDAYKAVDYGLIDAVLPVLPVRSPNGKH
ncbi:MAG: ATP-dependent Clp protease proteolytic subunit [Chloroflexota bacterium]